DEQRPITWWALSRENNASSASLNSGCESASSTLAMTVLSCERALASLPAAYCGRSARAGPTSAAVSRTTTVDASCGSLEDRLRCNSLLAGIPGPNTQAVRGSYHAVVPSLVTSSDGQ